MYKCRTCGKDVSETTIVCPHCGESDAIYNASIKFLWSKYRRIEKNWRIKIGVIAAIIWLTWGTLSHGTGWVVVLWLLFNPVVLYWLGLWLFGETSDMKELESEISRINALRDKLKS